MAKARLHNYSKLVHKYKFPLACPICDFRSKSYDMREHLLSRHCFGKKDACPWCLGDYSWPRNKKMHHVEHLERCYKRFAKECLTVDVRFQSRLRAFGDFQEDFWTRIVEECEVPLKCPRCDESVFPKHLERHYVDSKHGVDVKKRCVFCDGRYDGKDARHLKTCLERRVERRTEKFSFDPRPTCPERQMFGREKRFPLEYYDDMFVRYLEEEDDESIDFRGNVQLAKVCVTLFSTRPDWKWYHVMVRDAAVEAFRGLMEENRDAAFTLPFWCWCDGGETDHRHMILVVTGDDAFMAKKWRRRLAVSSSSSSGRRWKTSKPVKSWWHLVNAIHYVSNRRSRCSGGASRHYCIGKSLPSTFKTCIASLREDGFQRLLTERFGHVKEWWMRYAIRGDRRRAPASCLWKADVDEVLPVSLRWVPDPRGREGLWLLNGRKLYFSEKKGDDWLEAQRKGGNVFPLALHGGFWTPPPHMQREADVLAELRRENAALRERIGL